MYRKREDREGCRCRARAIVFLPPAWLFRRKAALRFAAPRAHAPSAPTTRKMASIEPREGSKTGCMLDRLRLLLPWSNQAEIIIYNHLKIRAAVTIHNPRRESTIGLLLSSCGSDGWKLLQPLYSHRNRSQSKQRRMKKNETSFRTSGGMGYDRWY